MLWILLCRVLAVSNVAHFLSFWYQIGGLVGPNGLRPAKEHLSALRAHRRGEQGQSWLQILYKHPTVFWLCGDSGPSSHTLSCVYMLGAVASASLLVAPESLVLWTVLFALSLSLIEVLGPFNLQQEPLMAEINLLVLMGLLVGDGGWTGVWLMRWFTLRFMLSAGLVKMFGSKRWKHLTALQVHYYTQPLPNPLAYYAHRLPMWVHKAACAGTLVIEGPLCLLALAPWPQLRAVAFLGFTGLMAVINLTGNYGCLGLVTSAISVSLLDDRYVPAWATKGSHLIFSETASWSTMSVPVLATMLQHCFRAVCALYVVISVVPVLHCTKIVLPPSLFLLEKMYDWVRPLRVVNRYGMFGAMHDFRWELIVQGSSDGETWETYDFPFKVSRARDRPPVALLYWPRLDWMLWFLPLRLHAMGSPPPSGPRASALVPYWFHRLELALLTGNAEVLALVKHNPFAGTRPKYVRTLVQDFSFATDTAAGAEHCWWQLTVAVLADDPAMPGDVLISFERFGDSGRHDGESVSVRPSPTENAVVLSNYVTTKLQGQVLASTRKTRAKSPSRV